jgi:DNA-binding PadR family transcriptional regulator
MARTQRRKVANPLGLVVLALLRERPMHPYEMAATLRHRAKEESIKLNYGSLYSVVEALQREGLILARESVRDGARPERTIYVLSDRGQVELRSWMRDLLSVPVKEYSQFEAALSLMPVLPPEEVLGLLDERVRRLDEDIERRQALIQVGVEHQVARLFMIEAEYLLAMREAERAWVGDLLHLIRTSPEFTEPWRKFHTNVPQSATADDVTAREKEEA